MFERLTGPSRDVVTRAVGLAAAQTASQTRPEHLFRALLDREDGLAARVLVDCGASLPRLRAELDRRRLRYVDGLDDDDAEALAEIGIDLDEVVRRIDRTSGSGGRRPSHPRLSRSAKKALELALREAVTLRHGAIGAEHLLLGLVQGGDRLVLDTLVACGVEPSALRQRVADAVGTP